jgi:hypothetical protein
MTTKCIRKSAAKAFLALLLVWMTGCSMQPPPVWVVGEGQGLQVPWRKPGEALRSARETAILEARLRIRGQLLPEPILRQDGQPQEAGLTGPTSPTSPTGLTTPTGPASSSAPGSAPGLLPLDNPTSATWRIDTSRRSWSSEEKALLKSMTVEQLAATSPAFRAKFDHMIGNLDPLSVTQSPDGIVVVRMRMDKNEVLRLARKYLEQQTRL